MADLLVTLLINIAIMALIFYVVSWALTQIPVPPPIGQIVRVILVLAFVLWLIKLLLPLAGMHVAL